MHIVYAIAPGGGPEAFVKTIIPWLESQGHCITVVYQVSPFSQSDYPSSVRVFFAPPGDLHYYAGKLIGSWRDFALRLRAWETDRSISTVLERIAMTQPIDVIETIEGRNLVNSKSYPIIVRAQGAEWTVRHYCRDGSFANDSYWIAKEARQLANADGVTAISRHLATQLHEFCFFPLNKIQVIPYPIDERVFQPTSYGPGDQQSLIAIGRLEKRKGVHVLIQAMPRIWRSFPGVTLVLLGSESSFKQTDLLRYLPMTDHHKVVFPGFVDRRRVLEYLRRATIYVAPTQYETFGYTILEAMACGVPVVASAVGAIPELVDQNVTGLLVPWNSPEDLAEAIVSLLADSRQRTSMRNQARDKVLSQYTVGKIGPQNLALYQTAISRKSQ